MICQLEMGHDGPHAMDIEDRLWFWGEYEFNQPVFLPWRET